MINRSILSSLRPSSSFTIFLILVFHHQKWSNIKRKRFRNSLLKQKIIGHSSLLSLKIAIFFIQSSLNLFSFLKYKKHLLFVTKTNTFLLPDSLSLKYFKNKSAKIHRYLALRICLPCSRPWIWRLMISDRSHVDPTLLLW